ncbi:DASH complex subunit Dad4-domain-containing protein [Gigaspora rosea]|uniref:DASH complex subunit DAD4 n=2 Tax=Gigaspora TaxID=4873 RepID=A0A397W2F7_9GLOM|nr:DASH complex subunit Dad4-domain-containing protein [Gigaspora rosea]
MATKSVENPHEEQQKTLLNRIVSNVKKLNDVLEDMNSRIQEINEYNRDIVVLSQFWTNYNRNATFNLMILSNNEKIDYNE